MLTNYDAKAVADVMGIAFLRGEERERTPAATPARPASGHKPAAGVRAGKFVFEIDHDSVRIVHIGTDNTPALPEGAGSGTGTVGGSGRLRVWPPSPVLIEKAVEHGLPRFVLRHVAEQLAGGDRARVASLEWVVVPRTTLERREQQLSPQESERTERVARLFVHARRALGSAAEAREFMTTPHPQLDGRSPIDAARTDLGTRRTEQILNALEYGLAL